MTEEQILEAIGKVEVREGIQRTIKSYALRSNVMDDAQRRIVLDNYERYCTTFSEGLIDPRTLFKDPAKPVIVEIGFGMGSSTQVIAKERDGFNYLCLEVYLVGFVKLLRDVSKLELDNIRLMRFNAVDVLQRMIADSSVQGFHIFFPDPWPKKKHHKRRLIQPDFVSLLSRKLVKGGYIYMVTDWREYAEWSMEIFSQEPLLSDRPLEADYEVREKGPGEGLRDKRAVVRAGIDPIVGCTSPSHRTGSVRCNALWR